MSQDVESYEKSLAQLGLSVATVKNHAALLQDAVRRQSRPCFQVVDTCRVDNGGLLPEADHGLSVAQNGHGAAHGFVAFVPAAGAASRYSQPLFELTSALERGDGAALEASLRTLAQQGAHEWPLPASLAKLLAEPEAARHLTAGAGQDLLAELTAPKALMPCVKEGYSFLSMKTYEHERLRGLQGQVFVTPPGQEQRFEAALAQSLQREARGATPVPTRFVEQGPALSTIRFHRDGRPFVEPDGRLSPVPAGHGALAQLFPKIGQLFPEAHSLFIRNIDNVAGTHAAVVKATEAFLAAHRAALTAVQGIRQALARDDVVQAAEFAETLLTQLDARRRGPEPKGLREVRSAAERTLWETQLRLFHANAGEGMTRDRLSELYERPVNVLGQVPNTAKDVGGTPCFLRLGDGVEKVCVEVPHVSEADKNAYLANPAKATHFNPVFVAAEITAEPDYYSERNQSFWLMSEKTYRGQPVMYFETVLYELLGNSELANCLFLEVPRAVFNPHKALKDAAGRTAADWLA